MRKGKFIFFRLPSLIVFGLFLLVFCVPSPVLAKMKEIRVWGGTAADHKDGKGRKWYGAQKDKQDWGGWVKQLPQTASAQGTPLTDDADKLRKKHGYDEELFFHVSWAANPATVKYEFKTGKGVFDVTYMVREHWSPNNRGYDIIIEGDIVEELYVTPGRSEIDIMTYEGIEVKDGELDFECIGNPKTGKGDLNPMFSALEIVPSKLAVDAQKKLTTFWGYIKGQENIN
jgi:hypothetical protein